MRLPEWLFRRRRFRAQRWTDDRDACQGADGLEAAVNWMQFVLGRDYDGLAVKRCVIVAEVGEGQEAQTFYTGHSVDATPVEIRGLLSEGLRGQAETVTRAIRQRDIEQFANAVLPELTESLQEAVFSRAAVVLTNLREATAAEEADAEWAKQQDPDSRGGMDVEDVI